MLDEHEFRVDRGEAAVIAAAALWFQTKQKLNLLVQQSYCIYDTNVYQVKCPARLSGDPFC